MSDPGPGTVFTLVGTDRHLAGHPLRRPDGHTDRPLFLMADQPESGLMDQFVYIHFLPHYPNQIAGFEHRIGIRIS